MTQSEKVKAARQFAEAWKGRGYEKGDAQVFWTELLRDLIGMEHVSRPEEPGGRMVAPFEQALAYAESFGRNKQPRFIVMCNFGTFCV